MTLTIGALHHGIRSLMFLGILLGGFLIIDLGNSPSLVSDAWAAPTARPGGPAGGSEPGGPIEPSGDPLCPDVTNTGSGTESSTSSESAAVTAAITTATTNCVSGLGVCVTATIPPHADLCHSNGTHTTLNSVTVDFDDGTFWDSWAATADVSCRRDCKAGGE